MFKVKPYRNKKYLDYLKDKPCVWCEATGRNDAHHIGGLGSGMGTKNSDLTCITLCRKCHTQLHSGVLTFDQSFYLAKTVQKLSDLGVLTVKL